MHLRIRAEDVRKEKSDLDQKMSRGVEVVPLPTVVSMLRPCVLVWIEMWMN